MSLTVLTGSGGCDWLRLLLGIGVVGRGGGTKCCPGIVTALARLVGEVVTFLSFWSPGCDNEPKLTVLRWWLSFWSLWPERVIVADVSDWQALQVAKAKK